MSIFKNEKEEIPIEQLKNYTGTDVVMQVLSTDYQDIKARFFDKNLPVRFLHPGIKKGDKIHKNVKAISQETIPWKARIKSKGVDVPIRYCANAIPGVNGGFTFSPSHLDITEPRWTYQPEEIDKILVLMQTSHYKKGIISIVDDNANDTKRAESRGKSAAVSFHIFEEGGDLFANEEKLNKFCLSWGISIKGKFAVKKKNELADKIETAESQHDKQYGYDAFKAALKDDDPYMDIRSTVQSALDNNLIRYEQKKYQVVYPNGETLVKIPVDKAGNWKNHLFEFLGNHPEIVDTLDGSNDTAPKHEMRRVELKEPVTV